MLRSCTHIRKLLLQQQSRNLNNSDKQDTIQELLLLPFEYKDLGAFRSRSPLKREIKSEGIAIPQAEKPDTLSQIQRDVAAR